MPKQRDAHVVNSPKYKDKHFIDKYVVLWAYGYRNGIGRAEGLYRAINELGFSSLDPGGAWNILDIGCGVGRTTSDYARFFTAACVTGIDAAPQMLERARAINTNSSGETLQIDMSWAGFMTMELPTQNLTNLNFKKATIEEYAKTCLVKYDVITAVNLLDRLSDVPAGLKLIYDLLKTGGIFICCTPLNFSDRKEWEAFGNANALVSLFSDVGFYIEIKFDGLPYRELIDGRGAYEEYPTLMIKAVKL